MLYINQFEQSNIDFVQTGYKNSFFRGHHDFVKIIFRDEKKTKIFRFERITTTDGRIKKFHASESYLEAIKQVRQFLKT